MKTLKLTCAAFLVLCGGLAFADSVDPRERAYVDPVRIVWKTTGGGEFSSACSVTGETNLLVRKYGQTPEVSWNYARGRATACTLENAGNVASIILDFGRELHGGLCIGTGASSARGMKVRLRFGESVSETCSDAASGEKGAGNDHAIRDSVIDLPGMGTREVGETGFRFVRIDLVTAGKLVLESVRAVATWRPMKELGAFRCSDERLNRIYDTAVRTAHLCCQRYLWDGIKRDRLVWMGDTYPMTMTILSVFGAAPVLPESLDYMMAITDPDREWMNGMAPWTLWFVRNLAAWYRFTGDRDYLEKHIDYLERTTRQIAATLSPSNTCDMAGFLDWPSQHNRPAVFAGMQALAAMTFEDAAFLGRETGRTAFEAQFLAQAKRLRANPAKPNGSKQVAALLALSRFRTPEDMFREVLGRDGCNRVSTFYGYFMLEAMSAAGENRHALDTVRDYWGAMLDVGATSFWEDFNVAWTNNCFRLDEMPVAGKKDVHGDYGEFCYSGFRHSLCHGWSSGPAPWLINNILGIRSLDVGCTKVAVRPFLGDLDWAEGAMALPGGRALSVRVTRRTDGSLDTTVSAPDGVEVVRP